MNTIELASVFFIKVIALCLSFLYHIELPQSEFCRVIYGENTKAWYTEYEFIRIALVLNES